MLDEHFVNSWLMCRALARATILVAVGVGIGWALF